MDMEVEVPSHFLCPISMQLMRDPVTISTGITYDRTNIEKWLFTCRSKTCPVTKQHLSGTDLTPNHTLRRLIQSWCTLNSPYGFDRIPTPKQPIDKSQVLKLLNDARKSPENQIKSLRRIRSIAQASDRNKICLEASGAIEFLSALIENENENENDVTDEALTILCRMQCSDTGLKKLINGGLGFTNALLRVMRSGKNSQSRSHAVMLLRSVYKVADPVELTAIKPEVFTETVSILKDGVSQQATKAALELILEIISWGRNRIKAAESGMVSVLIELLIGNCDRRVSELILVGLDQICRCAEGRAEFLNHGAGVAIVSKKILRVSHMASDRAVRVLGLVARFSGNCRVVQEMLEVGVVSKLCLVLQVDCSLKTKERVKEILRLHSRVWKDAPCIPPHLLSSYPSS